MVRNRCYVDRLLQVTIILVQFGLFAAPAAAGILTFNDLGPACSPGVPAAYHGLIWSSNFQLECNSDYAATYGNSYGAPSGYAATNGSLTSGVSEISIASGTFDFVSADFSSFAGADSFQAFSAESLQLYAYRPGDAIDNPTFVTTLDLDPSAYGAATLNWTGVEALFIGAGDGPASDPNTIFGADGLSWLMTDAEINIDQPVTGIPEPSSFLPLAMCLAAGLFVRSQKEAHDVIH